MRGIWDGRAWLLWALAAALAVLFAWLDYAGHLGEPATSPVPDRPEQNTAEDTSEVEASSEQEWVEFEVTDD